jgi:hypothetical protein
MFKGFSNRQGFNGVPDNGSAFSSALFAYSYPNCRFWLDANRGTNTQVNGANVSQWIDQASGIIFAQTTAINQPTYVLNDANFNNFPSVDFNPNTKFLRPQQGKIDTYGPKTTIVCVVKPNLIMPRGNIIFTGSVANLDYVNVAALAAGGGEGPGVSYGPTQVIRFGSNTLAAQIIVITTDRIFVNGVKNTIGGPWSPRVAFDYLSASDLNYSLNSRLAEALIYNRYFEDSEVFSLMDILNAKYAIY